MLIYNTRENAKSNSHIARWNSAGAHRVAGLCRYGGKNQRRNIKMFEITIKQLLEAGVHFGHPTKKWNPKMADNGFELDKLGL